LNSCKKAHNGIKNAQSEATKSSHQMYYNPLFLQSPSIQEAAFLSTDLGQLYQSIPFKNLATKFFFACV
jgi:hypothetical protein